MTEPVECVFSISTGRAGSHYLTTLFEHVEACEAHHEPDPAGNGAEMRAYWRGDPGPMRDVADAKAARVRAAAARGEVYVETNHCFIKGFGWLLPGRLDPTRMGVVVLDRDEDSIISSTLRIRSSPFSRYGRNWLLDPVGREAEVEPPTRLGSAGLPYALFMAAAAPWRRGYRLRERLGLDTIQPPAVIADYERELLSWYVAETRALGERFLREHPGVRVVRTDVAELSTRPGVERMLGTFGLTASASITEVIGRRSNTKSAWQSSGPD